MELPSPRAWPRPVQASHTNSSVWVSPLEKIQDRWLVIKDNLGRVRFDRSPFVPQDRQGYVEYLASQAEDSARKEKKRLAQLEAERGRRHPWIIPFNGRSFSDNRSAVLALPSIWSLWYETPQSRPGAPWPTPDEFREEGDERHTSGFGRFLPLPRVPGNETVVWKQKAFLGAYELDHVNPVLWRENTPKFLEEEEQTLTETWMTELHGSSSDGGTMRDASVHPTASTANPTAGEHASVSTRTNNFQFDNPTVSPFMRGVDSAASKIPGPRSSFRKNRILPRYNPVSEFFPNTSVHAKQGKPQPLPQQHSCVASSKTLYREDGTDGDDLLCQEETNDVELLQSGRLCSPLVPQNQKSMFDIQEISAVAS